ncbi:prepilin peptidase [Pedomonas mirosovicensis]|uniref:prepilin peptidase n=1 Tax=Pedomonas mirosovicensis TaxID=2908641 RepID=UPI0021683908|nr:A24 family peptidase [Pedomonas mirosovicensis]MCH8686333.1 A24 family peptidase [Pedomonas mirosovicensis]
MDAGQTEEDQADYWRRGERLIAAALLLLHLAGLAVFHATGQPWALGLPLLLTLLALSLYDLRYMLLPDVMTLPLIGIGLAAAFLAAAPNGPQPWGHLAGAAIGYGVLYLVNAAYRAWRGRDGLGLGDAKLLAAAGAWLGIFALPFLLLLASAAGLLAGIGLAVARRQKMGALMLPFGPFIAFAFFLLWLFPLPY